MKYIIGEHLTDLFSVTILQIGGHYSLHFLLIEDEIHAALFFFKNVFAVAKLWYRNFISE